LSQRLHQWVGLDEIGTSAQTLPRKLSQPERITLQTAGNDLTVTLPWSWKRSWFVVLPVLGWGIYALVQALGQLAEGRLGNGLLLVVIAFPAMYLVAAFWRNSTHVRITESRLVVQSRPLPWWDGKALDAAEIQHLGAEPDAFDGQEVVADAQRKWRMYARLTDETRITLLEDIQQDEARFIVQELEYVLFAAVKTGEPEAGNDSGPINHLVPNSQQIL
jgi:hypothetical protein